LRSAVIPSLSRGSSQLDHPPAAAIEADAGSVKTRAHTQHQRDDGLWPRFWPGFPSTLAQECPGRMHCYERMEHRSLKKKRWYTNESLFKKFENHIYEFIKIDKNPDVANGLPQKHLNNFKYVAF
jgi:hypothetical protein